MKNSMQLHIHHATMYWQTSFAQSRRISEQICPFFMQCQVYVDKNLGKYINIRVCNAPENWGWKVIFRWIMSKYIIIAMSYASSMKKYFLEFINYICTGLLISKYFPNFETFCQVFISVHLEPGSCTYIHITYIIHTRLIMS